MFRIPVAELRSDTSLQKDLLIEEIDVADLFQRLNEEFGSAPKDLNADYTFDSIVQFYAPQLPENEPSGPNPTTTRP
ncbi:MAG: hypothetical protein AAF585_14795 [Verrucomicrobiota bacterium]